MRFSARFFVTGVSLAVMWAFPALSDTISVSGQVYENVYVREGKDLFFVQTPSDGKVFTVPKADVGAEDLTLSTDPAERQSILDAWKNRNAQMTVLPAASEPASVRSREAAPAQSQTQKPRAPKLVLRNATLRDVLDVVTRAENMDYSIEGQYIVIDTPQRLRHQSTSLRQTREYALTAGADTLPKVLVANAGYSGGTSGMYGGGYSRGPAGAYGGGAGMGYGQGGQGYLGGAGMGYGQGGQGYLGGGNVYGPLFSNISDLFTTIDDRLVGEPLARIHTQVSGRGSR